MNSPKRSVSTHTILTEQVLMKLIPKLVAAAAVAGATAVPLQAANAWGGGGPWGGNMFGMDFGQSYGYGNRWYPSGGWGYPGYGGWGGYPGYGGYGGYGMMPYGYGYPPTVVAPAAPEAAKKY